MCVYVCVYTIYIDNTLVYKLSCIPSVTTFLIIIKNFDCKIILPSIENIDFTSKMFHLKDYYYKDYYYYILVYEYKETFSTVIDGK